MCRKSSYLAQNTNPVRCALARPKLISYLVFVHVFLISISIFVCENICLVNFWLSRIRYNLCLKYSFKKIKQSSCFFFYWIWYIMIWFIYKIKPIFMLYKKSNLNMYCEMRFDDLILWRIYLIYLQSIVEEFLWDI